MSDFLLDLSRNPTAKKLIQAAGLPIPLPTPLDRPKGPYAEQVLRDKVVVVGGEGQLTEQIAQLLVIAGANPYVVGDRLFAAFAGPGETFGRRPTKIAADESPEGLKLNGLVFDATGLQTAEDLKQIYDFFHPRVRQIARSGRALIIARPPEAAERAELSAVRQALEGFTRSFAKEIGKHGATANIVYVAEGAESRLAHVARFILSSASAFVTGQPFRVSTVAKGEINT